MNYCTTIPKQKIPAVPRIIVIGDIHGDWAALKSALKSAKVTNHHNDWIGGSTHVVQVGDILDRATRTHGSYNNDEKSESKILKHLIDLKYKAQKQGGDFHLLLGNHELMNVNGNFKYVSPLGLTDFDGQRQILFKPGGKLAVKLACNANSVLQIGSWIFSHAGVTSEITKKYSIEQVNNRIRNYLLGNEPLNNDHPLMDIFWHRKYGNETACPAIKSALDNWKAKNMAIGHTVQQHGINSICNDALWKLDVGMSDSFGMCGIDGKSCIEVLEIIDDGDAVNVIKGKKTLKNNYSM